MDDILFVGTQENLNKDFLKLIKILEVPKAVKLTKNVIKMHKNPDDVDKRISPEAERNLRDWYSKDYEFIQLCKDNGLINNSF